jgi:ATP-dependent helicase/nuclease subunit A
MGDLESAALTLMSDLMLSGWVQERLDTRVRHLLIDEFQDTNPLQWQALHAWLSGYTGAGTAPSVFIVGDPKQSIYRFRRAEPQVFIAAKEFVCNGLQGEVLSCDHTRRNAQAIIGLVNTVMGEAQAQGQIDGFRAHSTESELPGEVIKLARIAREPKAKAKAQATTELEAELTWRDSLSTPRFEEEESRKSIECCQAAHWILQALQSRRMPDGRALLPGDIMVLARKRERLALMQAELSALHIAAQQPEKNDLADMPEVQDLVALLDVLVSQRHDIALARVLKSPLFGVSDDALVQLVCTRRDLQAQAPEDQVVSWLETLQRGVGLPSALTDACTMLLQWQDWVANLPPHDALSSIYQSGDVLARYAAACTLEMRDSVLANLKALLHAALAFDGGRYTTAYSLVRALRAGGIKAPVRADSAAVRLLTVHGAKGLEAPVVVLLDTDGEAQKGESMGVLVEWPGQAEHPTRFVFLVSESRPSPCAAYALAIERLARSREELNGLYVALTRTQQTLVVSSMEPLSANPLSWWQRLQGHAHDVEPMPAGPLALSGSANVTDERKGNTADFLLKELPVRTLTGGTAPSGAVQGAASVQESLESRIGQAMHRLLEWLPVRVGGYGEVGTTAPYGLWSREQSAHVANEFVLDTTQVESASRMALGIAQGQGAWCWNQAALQWHANEVPVNRGGRLLRIDRLVQDLAGQWWVLDYKSNAEPQLQPELCAQLTGYRATIQSAYPGQMVRCAFLTPQGALIEIANP